MFPKETRILIVDDMMTMRKIVAKTLRDIGFSSIVEADDGETAWPKIEACMKEQKPFQLIISDWNMPKLKGIDLLRKIRMDATMKAVPFLLLTAEAEKTQIVEAIQAGVSGYIVKPFTPAQMQEKLQAVWQKQVATK